MRLRILVAGLALVCCASAALAENDDKLDAPGSPAGRMNSAPPPAPPPGRTQSASLRDPEQQLPRHERDVVRAYFESEYGRGKCPPGLAMKDKKEKLCLPPGQLRKRYAVGRKLSSGVAIAPIPIALSRKLGAPPIGYRYGMVDGDLIKLSTGTLTVVDAVGGYVPKE